MPSDIITGKADEWLPSYPACQTHSFSEVYGFPCNIAYIEIVTGKAIALST